MKQIITSEQKILLNLISKVVFSGSEVSDEGDIDINTVSAVLNEAKHQAVIPIAFEGCVQAGFSMDGSVYMDYFTKSAKITAKNQNLLLVQESCRRIFEKENIRFTVIKGAAVSAMYDNPEIRSMGDIDILVPPEQFEAAMSALINNGFSYKGGEGDIHREFVMNGCVVELHFEINGIPVGKKGDEVRKIFKDFSFDIENCRMDGFSFPRPCPYVHGIVLLLHMYEHLQTGGIGLRHLCDWGVFSLRYLNNSESCYEILEKFKELSIYKFCAVMTATAKKCFSIPFEFEWYGDIDEDLIDGLIFDIFDGGNFGYKKPEERYMSDILVKRKAEEDRGTVFRGFSNFKERIYTSMPITKKHPILIATAPFYIPVRYIFRVATGKRKKVNAVKMVQKSSERRMLYDKFDMFKN